MRRIQKLLFVFSLLLVVPLAFLFSACDVNKLTADNVQVRVSEDYVQWSYDGTNWENIVSVNDLKEQLSDTFKGDSGDRTEFRKTDTYIQWRYVGDSNWNNLIAIEDISGEDLVATECTITYDFNLNYNANLYASINNDGLFVQEGFTLLNATQDDGVIFTQKATKGNYFDLYNFTNVGLNDYFDGWYVKDIKVNELNIVGGDKTLIAHWKKDFIEDVNTIALNYQFNEESLTANFQGFLNSSYNTVNLKRLVSKDNKYYTITGLNMYIDSNSQNEKVDYSFLDAIQLPSSITNDNGVISRLIDDNIYVYGEEKDKTNENLSYCLNYAFQSTYQYSPIEIVYLINYENETCSAIHIVNKSFGLSNGATIDLSNLQIDNSKKQVILTLNSIRDSISESNISGNYELLGGFVSWESLVKFRTLNVILPNTVDHVYSTAISPKGVEGCTYGTFVVNLFYKGTKEDFDTKEISFAKDYLKYDNGYYFGCKVIENVYFYSETEAVGAYWKYNNDGKPEVWNNVNCNVLTNVDLDENLPTYGAFSGYMLLGDKVYGFGSEVVNNMPTGKIQDYEFNKTSFSDMKNSIDNYKQNYYQEFASYSYCWGISNQVELNSAHSYVIYRFTFVGYDGTALSHGNKNEFKATLQYNSNASDENISVLYGTSIDNINSSTPIELNINNENSYSSTIYVKISIDDLTANAKLRGNLTVNFTNN